MIRPVLLALALACPVLCGPAAAETSEVRMSRGLSLGFLPSIVMEDQKLIEKQARAAGLGEVAVSWNAVIGGVAMNDLLLAGQVDFAGGGPPPFALLWAKTRGTPLAVKAMAAMNASPMYLLTRNPDVKSIKDFGPKDRIAVPGIRISNQAVVLQMVAEKVLGDSAKLDPLTVPLSLPDGFAALHANSEVTAQFSGPPFQYQDDDMRANGIRKILNSEEVLGGPTTFLMMWTTTRFHDANPKTYAAVYAALKEAIDIINSDHGRAADIFLRVTRQKIDRAEVLRILDDPGTRYGVAPQNVMTYVDFLHRKGVIGVRPDSWKDMFFPGPVLDLQGS